MKSSIRKSLLVGILAAATSASALACLNGTYFASRLSGGGVVGLNAEDLDAMLGNTRPGVDEKMWIRRVTEAVRSYPNFEDRNDYAVALVHLGKYQEAITVLQKLEHDFKDNYQVAANLGTAFELAGDNKQALQWIREGIRRNPQAHEGTEWLHVAILEAKLGQRPAGDAGHSLLQLDYGPRAIPSRPMTMPKGNDGSRITLPMLGLALRYQLIERTHFVKAPDPMVAALLTDWAHVELIAGDAPTARMLYRKAVDYGAPLDERLMAARAAAARAMAPAEMKARKARCELCG